ASEDREHRSPPLQQRRHGHRGERRGEELQRGLRALENPAHPEGAGRHQDGDGRYLKEAVCAGVEAVLAFHASFNRIEGDMTTTSQPALTSESLAIEARPSISACPE